ncbi:PaaI family thioesterase [Nocardioides sp. zg-DK7169]|uniref:PaaI family thioesterase n=1 Tax=Nocardioides sp. zg-DK7169 TaxID=2736600 RepID=UPI001554ADD6|nr:hotdog domain-containing protein [Nocardioides sp. zg-DK7169]NPC98685.1 PaaI family thioesterase [Nocardioides sp. zg-DK7169]
MPVVYETTEVEQETAELVSATRDLMRAVATTGLGAEGLRAARAEVERLTARLAQDPRDRVLRAPLDGPARARAAGEPWSIFRYSPQALPLDISFGDGTAHARTMGDALYEGPRDSVHGGYLAHLLDCMLGTLVQSQGLLAVTATLDLRYLHRTPLDVPLDLHARILERSGRRLRAEGWVEHEGTRTVEATGLFIEIAGTPS